MIPLITRAGYILGGRKIILSHSPGAAVRLARSREERADKRARAGGLDQFQNDWYADRRKEVV